MANHKRLLHYLHPITTEMYGSLQGIAGSAVIRNIDALELPGGFEDEN